MIGRTNAGGSGSSGGAIKPENAILVVTAPTGSTVTAIKGNISLTPTMWVKAANNTLDCALFSIKPNLFDSQNAWTVTGTLGTESASTTIVIDSNKEYEAEITYALYLIRNGIPLVSLTVVTGATVTSSSVKFNRNTYNVVRTSSKIDLTKYKSMFADMIVVSKDYAYPFNVVATNGTSQGNYISGNPSNPPDNSYIAYNRASVPSSGYVSVSCDITSVTSSAYVGIATYDVNASVSTLVLRR